MAKTAARKKADLPRYDERRGWIGGDSRTLYAFTDRRTGDVFVYPGGGAGKKLLMHAGPEADVRVASRSEAESLWQSPLHVGWKVAGSADGHATKKRLSRRKLPAIARGKVMKRIVSDDKRFVISQLDPSTYWILDLDWYNEGTAKDLEGAYQVVRSMRAKHP